MDFRQGEGVKGWAHLGPSFPAGRAAASMLFMTVQWFFLAI